MNQCPPCPWVFPWGRFKFFWKFAEIFANECLSPVLLTPAIRCSPVSTTSAINPCHWFSVIAGVVDTGEKFITGDNYTDEQLSPVTTTPVIRVCGMSIDVCFHGGSNETIIGHVWLCFPDSLILVINNQKAKFIASVNDTAKKLFISVNDTADKLFAGFDDTANKTVLTLPAWLDLNMKKK